MKKILFGTVAVLALSAPAAFAQQATGLYVSAGVGANWLENVDGTYQSGGTDDSSFRTDVGPMGVVAVGYDFGMFRTEAELGLRTNDIAREYYQGSVFEGTSGHFRTISVMANALVDVDVGPVTLYGGGGLGIAAVEFNYQNLSQGYDERSTFDTVWAYQGIAGLAYNISPNLAVTGEYRYLGAFEDLRFDNGFDDGEDFINASFGNHSALIGLRYTFGAAPAAVVVEEVVARSYLVFFDFDSSALTADARSIVASAAQDALAGGSPRLDVTGHTDRSGSDAYNQALSVRRATSVQNELIANGVPADIIVIRGAGERENLVPTADGVREPQNRRVEIVIN